MATMLTESTSSLIERFRQVRQFTDQLVEPLSAEDCMIQSMPDASPTRWHLAHTTWFFETFVLRTLPGYEPYDLQYEFLFNSYYNRVGHPFPRARRGLLSRPGLEEIRAYRRMVDERLLDLLDSGRMDADQARVVELGLQHEQQHQELILTDIKHALAQNPLFPVYRRGKWLASGAPSESRWTEVPAGVYEIGHASDGFAFDNESPRHRVFLESHKLQDRLVTCGEYLQFVEAGGYAQPEHWLSLGWSTVQTQQWSAPLYWMQRDGQWHLFTLAGLKPLDLARPVCHLSYFEADAFARWSGYRLPTEAEWEVAAARSPITGHFAETLLAKGVALHPEPDASASLPQWCGNVWQWTSSSYAPYPGYQPPDGALGEYNGKFMCNQYVLRGGSIATSQSHIRATYRNFFPPEARWQFTGLRLAASG